MLSFQMGLEKCQKNIYTQNLWQIDYEIDLIFRMAFITFSMFFPWRVKNQ